MNIYRGCSHGCIYCDSRSKCYGFTHAFEDIEVKENAPELLEKALRSNGRNAWLEQVQCVIPIFISKKRLAWRESVWNWLTDMNMVLQFRRNQPYTAGWIYYSRSMKSKGSCPDDADHLWWRAMQKIEPNVSTTRQRFEVLMECKEEFLRLYGWHRFYRLSMILRKISGVTGILSAGRSKGNHVLGMGVTLQDGDREYFIMHWIRSFQDSDKNIYTHMGMHMNCQVHIQRNWHRWYGIHAGNTG